jgi:hypothetical protein
MCSRHTSFTMLLAARFRRPRGCGDPYVVAKMDSRLRRKHPSETPLALGKSARGPWTKGLGGMSG